MKHSTSRLTVKFGLLLLTALAIASAFFAVFRFGGAAIMDSYFARTGFQQKCNEKRIASLQAYIEKNRLSARDREQITKWAKTQPLILLEIYRSNVLLYSSYAPEEAMENDEEAPHYSWVSYYEVSFSDGKTDVVIYADDSYRFFTLLTVAALGLSVLLFLGVFLFGCQSLIRYICELNDEIQLMEGGCLDIPITIKGDNELSTLAQSLDSMRKAFKDQKEREAEVFLANQTMISQMSHDLRTPMTILQIYTDILKYNRCKPEQVNDYLIKIDEKVAQMKQLSDNLFEYSLISKEQKISLDGPLPFREAVHDQLSESVAYLSFHGFFFESELDWPQANVYVHPPYIRRILDNVTSNISKYAAADVPLHICTGREADMVYLSFQNGISAAAAEQEGTRIGISNIKAMMEKMNGECRILHTDSVFRLTLYFPTAAAGKPEEPINPA
ncbi:MAG: HAMP domain-containing histidine kinase [Oscillospiraceae bacterium]|nr:HAMP domain-containing histidine kinase [Oscillospiraceae bacterium]